MASVTKEAEKLRVIEPKVKTWPRLEPLMSYFQINAFPKAIHKRLKILALQMDKPLPEATTIVIEAGLEIVERRANEPRKEPLD